MSTDNLTLLYRQKAAECLTIAGHSVDPRERIELLQIAQGYVRLADYLTAKAALLKDRGSIAK